ncbi:hypothetical protein FHL15_009937 [Xylaria flabelliformis]|uniref:UBC core domain-containing protein n=1 Tax=Xylaria flabelliformis TaxID=2512241 RepID=A0A553HMD5_9PEZI|nr:hypothetical protein FHL15_009937 [Xylaria flabelliformis]
MPLSSARNRLQADILAAGEETIPFIVRIGKGDVQDEFVFAFAHSRIPSGEIEIRVMPQDTASYPGDNYFLVYTDDEVPANIRKILEDAMISTKGMSIADLLKTLSRKLCSSLESADGEQDDGDDDIVLKGVASSEESDDSDLDNPIDYGDDDDFGLVDGSPHTARVKIRDVIFERIRKDFKAVRNAGFKVGKICGVDHRSAHSILSMSIRVSKLGLSKEIHASWNLEPSEYLVLLMKYDGEYEPFEDTMKRPVGQIPLSFRLRKCSKYRPTLAEATAAFSPARSKLYPKQSEQESAIDENSPAGNSSLLTFGIGDSIDLLLDTGFLSMMKIRKMRSVSWDEARKIHSHFTISAWDTGPIKMPILVPRSTGIADTNLPPVLMNDHLSSADPVSLPLVAMQFALRYLIKCTDYCMICHDRIDETFEALKPYVCGNPLCLYQYMSLGLGPSIDQEIINQEYVVDLLISFCYASLQRTTGNEVRLREFPSGLSLQVPCVRKLSSMIKKEPRDIIIDNYGVLIEPIDIEVSWFQRTATITNQSQLDHLDLKVGQWVVIHTEHNPELHIFHHARIEDKQGEVLQLHIASRHPVPPAPTAYGQMRAWDWDNENTGFTTGRLVFCNQSLDDLQTDEEKAFSLHLLLSTLPSVREMRSYLMGKKSRQLVTWDRIPPAAMKLLRWIIASNRSFIVQLDDTLSKETNSSDVGDKKPHRSEEKVSGLDGWIQFRFAQGSPEKEARFLEAVREVESPHRTILAWHGSAVGNWHSIIREGLDFKVIANGRAFGHGVYFSRSFDYSLSYSNLYAQEKSIWPQSLLQITQAISLNELVNQPQKFQHSVNCYVVDALHWIQCRYLFLICMGAIVFVPEIAIPSVQQRHTSTFSVSDGPNEYDTDDEDAEDISFLADGESIQSRTSRLESSKKGTDPSTLTDFRPGHLDFSKLPQFASPSYATKPAQQTIQRELQKLQKVQSATPLHELGWYIDFDKIDNMFQLIVELHSFDPSLPLAKDMKEASITSIVLEIRFLRGFPLTPPFIRVIKPRFLPFANGGGGHVTAGGAMCMELLTNTGWSPVSSMESVLLQVRLAMCNQEPKPARLEMARSAVSQYSIQEAIDAYIRAASVHGWEVPAELKEVAM